jgi:phage terminase small subunit
MAREGLTPKQARFVEEYLIDMNATAAAKRAGYAPKRADVIGYENLSKPVIQAALNAAQRERSARTGITADRVLREIARVALADPRNVMRWGPGGIELKDSASLTDDEAACVMEISETRSENSGSMKVKLHPKIAALEQLAKHVGLYDTQKLDITNSDGSLRPNLIQIVAKQ